MRFRAVSNYLLFFILLFIVSFSGCIQLPGGTPEVSLRPVEPGDELFLDAEKLLSQNKPEEALSVYVRYSAQFPQGRHADNALRRIGTIYFQLGQLDEATGFFQRLLNEHPRSRYISEARLALIDIYMLKQQFPEAIQIGLQLLSEEKDPGEQRQIQMKLAKLYRAQGILSEAVKIEYALYQSAKDSEKSRWFDHLKASIAQLDLASLEYIWDSVTDSELRSCLMYRYAEVQANSGNFDDALDVITVFLQRYPRHPNSPQAAILFDTLSQQLSFAPYTLGCLLPLSGPYELYGTRALQGIELALSMVQSAEAAQPIKLVIKDSASDDARAVQAVRELADAKVSAVLGPIVTAQAAAQEAQRLQIPMVTFTQKQDITAIGDYIFRHFITPENQVKTLVDYFTNHVGLREYAILYPKDTYGETFMTLFWDEVVRQGGRVVGIESYDTQLTDFAEPIKKLVGNFYPIPSDLQRRPVVEVEEDPYYQEFLPAGDHLQTVLPDPVRRLTGLYFQQPDQDRTRGPAIGRSSDDDDEHPNVDFDVLFIPDAPKKAGLIIPQLLFHDIKDVYLAGTNLWHSSQLVDMAQDYLQRAILVEGYFKDSQSAPVRRFVEAYQSAYKEPPGIIEAYAFDTARIFFELLAKPDIHMHHTLRDALIQFSTPYGVTGFTAFTDHGEAIKRLTLLEIKAGKFVEITHP